MSWLAARSIALGVALTLLIAQLVVPLFKLALSYLIGI